MPIPFTCPSCGKQMQVPDEYAGQTGPCAACGAQITIPHAMGNFSAPTYAPAKPSGGTSMLVVILAVVGVGGIMGMGCLLALLLPAVQAARTAARSVHSMNNMKQLGLAMHNYHDSYGELPPAVVKDANGKPLYSGRVLLLPFMEEAGLYKQWNKDKAWDSPENAALSATDIRIFMHPAAANRKPGQTDYLFLTGPGTCFDPKHVGPMKFHHITDGLSNTIWMVEVKNSTASWAEPKEIDIGQQSVPTDGITPRGVGVLFGDGSVRTIPKDANPLYFQKAATRAGGEILDPY